MKIVLLSARGLRAAAYAHVLLRHNDYSYALVEYGQESVPQFRFPAPSSVSWNAIPDWIRNDWLYSYQTFRNQHHHVNLSQGLNDLKVVSAVASLKPDLVIFAGGAGNIVGEEILSICPVLHLHPGKLPEYRGSTTIYWGLLNDSEVWCSAILLNREIDRGILLTQRQFNPPRFGQDVDRLYDVSIRACTLDEVLSRIPAFLESGARQHGTAKDYFVIHPVLKNVVLDSLPYAVPSSS